MLMWPAHRFVWPGHPQGKIFAPQGSVCLNPNTGRIYRKIAPPGSTAPVLTNTGWYKVPDPMLDMWIQWNVRATGASGLQANQQWFTNPLTTAGTGVATGPGNGNPGISQTGFIPLTLRTTGALNTGFCAGMGTQNPVAGDSSGAGVGVDTDFDIAWTIYTTPSTAGPLIANSTLWVVITAGTGAYGIAGGTTALKTAFAANTPVGGWGFRYVDGTDAGWLPMCCDPVGEFSGTAFAGGIPVANTLYRLRIRKLFNDPDTANGPAVYYSINDGAEQKITSQLAVPAAGSGGQQLNPSIAVVTQNGVSKSIALCNAHAQFGALY